jgi:hypothetical protein
MALKENKRIHFVILLSIKLPIDIIPFSNLNQTKHKHGFR